MPKVIVHVSGAPSTVREILTGWRAARKPERLARLIEVLAIKGVLTPDEVARVISDYPEDIVVEVVED